MHGGIARGVGDGRCIDIGRRESRQGEERRVSVVVVVVVVVVVIVLVVVVVVVPSNISIY
jgi:hypothetical protein